MRAYRIACLAMVVGVLGGCQPRREDAHEVLVRQHFQGLEALATRPELASLQAVVAQPASQKLLDHVVAGLATDVPAWFGGGSNRVAEAQGLQPLMRSVLAGESYLEIHGRAGVVSSWALAARLSPGDSAKLGTELGRTLAVALGVSAPSSPTAWELKAASGGAEARFAAVGNWTVFGRGASAVDELRQRVTAQGAPVAPSTNYLLHLNADLRPLASLWHWGDQPPGPVDQWPSVDLTVEPRRGRLRTSATLDYARPLGLNLEPWRVPTGVMHDPLVGFTAMQGSDQWLKRLEMLKPVDGAAWPRQFFMWSMAGLPWLQYFGGPLSQPTNLMTAIATALPTKLMPRMSWENTVFALRITNNATRMELLGIPWFQPYLEAAREGDQDMLVGGLFPQGRSKAPAPAGLIAQVAGRTNLVLYDWEITARNMITTNPPGTKGPSVETNFIGRLAHYRDLAQFGRLMLATNSSLLPTAQSGGILIPGSDWIRSAGPLLGETITEVTMVSPTRLSLVRQSQLGFAAYELMHVLSWLENPAFPGWTDEPAPAPAPVPRRAAKSVGPATPSPAQLAPAAPARPPAGPPTPPAAPVTPSSPVKSTKPAPK